VSSRKAGPADAGSKATPGDTGRRATPISPPWPHPASATIGHQAPLTPGTSRNIQPKLTQPLKSLRGKLTYALDGILARDFTRRRHAPATAPRVVILRLEGSLPIRPDCDSMMHGEGLPFAFISAEAFDLKRRRRHAALTSQGISSAARANAGARSGSDGGLAPGR
jgi:hypothetical protein